MYTWIFIISASFDSTSSIRTVNHFIPIDAWYWKMDKRQIQIMVSFTFVLQLYRYWFEWSVFAISLPTTRRALFQFFRCCKNTSRRRIVISATFGTGPIRFILKNKQLSKIVFIPFFQFNSIHFGLLYFFFLGFYFSRFLI